MNRSEEIDQLGMRLIDAYRIYDKARGQLFPVSLSCWDDDGRIVIWILEGMVSTIRYSAIIETQEDIDKVYAYCRGLKRKAIAHLL